MPAELLLTATAAALRRPRRTRCSRTWRTSCGTRRRLPKSPSMGQRPPAPRLSRRSMPPWQKQQRPSTYRMRRPAQQPRPSQPTPWMLQQPRRLRQRHSSRGPVQLLQMMCKIILTSNGGGSSRSSRLSAKFVARNGTRAVASSETRTMRRLSLSASPGCECRLRFDLSESGVNYWHAFWWNTYGRSALSSV
jgi:hypothetical protein